VTVLLGIDLGERRIGVATGDTATGAVRPILTLRRGTIEQDARAISRICAERRADLVVVGLPLTLDGGDSEQTARTRAWATDVAPLLDRPVVLRDERLTSASAEARLGRPPRGRAGGPPSARSRDAWRARVDREAAAGIVQRELDARATEGTSR